MTHPAFPPQAIPVLKKALRDAYWYKSDLRSFLRASEVPESVLMRQDWNEYKIKVIEGIVDDLLASGVSEIGPIRRMVRGLLEMPNLDHLKHLEDGPRKVQTARESIEALRTLVGRQVARAPETRAQPPVRARLPTSELKGAFVQMTAAPPQQRGFELERFLRDLFEAHDLAPKSSFRIQGEQVDGAFELDGVSYLVEARWEQVPQGAAPLDSLSRKVERKLGNTLGLFVSLSGFSVDGVEAFRRGTIRLLLMDGEDLAIVLDGLVDFVELLRRKRRHAAQTGDPYLRARDII